MQLYSIFIGILSFLSFVTGVPFFSPILAPSYPLAVRNPYLSAWLPGNLASNVTSALPQFWAGQQLYWAVMARVQNQTFSLFGVPAPASGVKAATVLSGEYSATRSVFKLQAGSTQFTLDFFSPVSPKNLLRQSLPFSYLSVSASVSDGSNPSIQVYSDIGGLWLGEGSNAAKVYNFTETPAGNAMYSWSLASPMIYAESSDMALWGQAIYATGNTSLTTQTGDPATVRAQFQANGFLNGAHPGWAVSAVTAFAHDLGSVKQTANVSFAIGYVREAAINYFGSARTGYYVAQFPTTASALDHFLQDYAAADAESRALDSSLASKAAAIAGKNYSDIVTLSLLQIFGAMDITIDRETLDTNSATIFVKEISSDGNVNTIDIIFPTFPALYVLNTEYIPLLLEPVMHYLAAGRWLQPFMIHDIGTHYPNATGHDDGQAEQMPIEESGNIILLFYLYQHATGNNSFTTKYSAILKKYADYLVQNGQYPAYQLATDDGHGAGANYTNLGIKAAVALNAYGIMTGQTNYSTTGKSFATDIYTNGLGTDANKTHFTIFYSNDTTWGTPFNLFPDVLLNMTTFPTSAIDMENSWYPQVRQQFGVQLDSRATWGKTDWMSFAAGTAMAGTNGQEVRDMFINDIHKFLVQGRSTVPFEDRYFVDTGVASAFRARPVVGGHFALMALDGPNQI